eukprot:TRINITY_DN12080_c0_g1_i1.p1 TRINITY_DN12080_c0_g1~~TRINITY_DN12080_c0_g1_i1.p1  ORF type:complete len:284 (+),score=57.89 TRINITY_DN12080_c0_g1_i1:76-927(+)
MPTLKVTVICGRKLESRHALGTCSPYVEIECEKTTKRTHTVKANRDPNWNETCDFLVREPTSAQLHITVMDDNKMPSRAMGKYTMSVSHLPRGKAVKQQLLLKDCSTGTLDVVLLAADFGIAQPRPAAPKPAPKQQYPPQQGYPPQQQQPPARQYPPPPNPGAYQQPPPQQPQGAAYPPPPPQYNQTPPQNPNYQQPQNMYPPPPNVNVHVSTSPTAPPVQNYSAPPPGGYQAQQQQKKAGSSFISAGKHLAGLADKGLDAGYKGAKKALAAAGANKQGQPPQ